jgi:murein DD-endopeptidase MepM/ murein hydrolase activator NlpD
MQKFLVALTCAVLLGGGGVGEVAALSPAAHAAVEVEQGSRAVRPVPGAVVAGFDLPDVRWEAGTRGVKLAARPGEEVRAALAGRVRFAGEVAGVGWVTVGHGGGLDTTYGDVDPALPVGRSVRAGEVIGHVREETDHLHWGSRLDGRYIDPMSLLRPWRARLVPLPDGGR